MVVEKRLGQDVFRDDRLAFKDEADQTKMGKFQLSGITAGNTRVLTWPDLDGTIALTSALTDYVKRDGTTPLTADWDVGNYDLTAKNFIGSGYGQFGYLYSTGDIDADGNIAATGYIFATDYIATDNYFFGDTFLIPTNNANALNIKTATTSAMLISTNQDPFVIDFNKASLVGMSRLAIYDETGTGGELLSFRNAENLSGNKNLDFVTGDASRVITLSGNPTLGDWFDQAVKQASNVTFGTIGCGVITADGLAVNTTDLVVDTVNHRVGIGTATPSYILDINAGEIGDNNYDGLRIVDTGWKAVSHPMLEFYNSHASFNGSLARIYGEIGNIGENSKLYFAVADSSKNLQDRMVIDKSGNVGIGETSPQDKLEVNGKIRGTNFTTAANILLIPSTDEIQFRDSDISIGSTLADGVLDMSADDSICMFYDNADVGDAVDGQSLDVYRRAAVGDDYLQFYVDSDREPIINASQTLKIQRQGSTKIRVASNEVTVTGALTVSGKLTCIDLTATGNTQLGATTDTARTIEFVRNGTTLGGFSTSNDIFSIFGGATPAKHFAFSSIGQSLFNAPFGTAIDADSNVEIYGSADNGNYLGGLLRLTNYDNTLAATQSIGELQWWSRDTSLGAGVKGFIKVLNRDNGSNYDMFIGAGGTATQLTLFKEGVLLASNKIAFTQTDLDEYVDSLNDGYMDYGATTGHRFNNEVVVTGAISSGTLTLSVTGPTDNLDVAGVNTVFINTADNNVTLGGAVNGVNGQFLHIVLINAANNFTIEDAEGVNQSFYLHAGADEVLNAEFGGWTFVCDGTDWHEVGHEKHSV